MLLELSKYHNTNNFSGIHSLSLLTGLILILAWQTALRHYLLSPTAEKTFQGMNCIGLQAREKYKNPGSKTGPKHLPAKTSFMILESD